MEQVWIVTKGYVYEGETVLAVCATLKRARLEAEKEISKLGPNWKEVKENMWENSFMFCSVSCEEVLGG